MYGHRILILIPHPDDEVVGCAAAIARARSAGSHILGFYLSHGCIPLRHCWPWRRGNKRDYDRRANLRLREAEIAAHILGIEIAHLERERAARDIWRHLPEILREVEAAVALYQPDRIWVPAYEGGNPDHDGANGMAALLPALCGIPVFEFSEYNFAGGKISAPGFISSNGTEIELHLTPEEIAAKKLALDLYLSEKGNLSYFRNPAREIFRPLASYDYARPPHDGTMFYARHQWVPFRHPRVDFTRPQEVCAAVLELHRSKAGV